ncbi:hypothetical protein CAP39_08725 [Sphingomonas sp. IBVSS1]|nr:hypothetical protein CAP39_08725 [Sphingomonas sp. IBVSS1]
MIAALLLLAAAQVAADPAAGAAAAEDPIARPCREAADAARPSRGQLARCNRAIGQPGIALPVRLAMLMNRGAARVKAGKLLEAVADFDLAIQAAPGLAEAWINKGIAMSRIEGRASEAIALISHGLEIGPKSPARAYFARAQAHEVAGNLKAAMEDFAAAARADPDWPAPAEELKRFHVERRKVLKA